MPANPEDTIIQQEELRQMVEDAHDRIQELIRLTFHRQELFEAWYAKNILSAPITVIAAVQGIGWKAAKHRVQTAEEIVIALRRQLHKIDDLRP